MANDLSEKYEIYNDLFSNLSFDDLLYLYSDTILLTSCTSDVERAMINYITSVIEPVGWKAIWNRTRHCRPSLNPVGLTSNCDFLVEVQDVSLNKLEATVKILEILSDSQKLEEHIDATCEMENTLNDQEDIAVPLIQLFPIHDKEGLFHRTAYSIEIVRFFYSHIWRPWDDDDDDAVFSEKHLGTRLKCYFEQQSGTLPEAVECRIREHLSEAAEIRMRLNDVQGQMDLSDSEEELDESDVQECMQLRYRMEVLQREMETLENPLLRNIIIKKGLPHKNGHKSEPTTHLVSQKVTFGMIKSLELDHETLLEIHDSFEQAVAAAASGDTILIFPGTYKTGPLPWLEHDISIKGVPGSERVTLEASDGCGELFFSCGSQTLQLCNLQLVPSCNMMAVVMLHEGSLAMDNCTLKGAKHCLVVLAEGKATLTNCTFSESMADGIQLRSGATAMFKDCSVQGCQGNGLSLDAPPKASATRTHLSFQNCQLSENGKYGVMAVCLQETALLPNTATWNDLERVPWLDLKAESVNCTGNKSGDLGFCYLVKPKLVSMPSPPDDYQDFLNSVSLKPQFTEHDDSNESVFNST